MELIYETGGDFLHEADEWLPGTLVSLTPDDGQYGPTIKWVFILDEDVQNGQGKETWAWSNQKVTTKNKTGRWITAIDPGVLPEVGQPVNLTPLVNARIDVMFERTTKQDGSEGERVVKVRASKVAAPADTEEPFEKPAPAPESSDGLFD